MTDLNRMYLDWAKTLGDPEGKCEVLTSSKAAFTAGIAAVLFHQRKTELRAVIAAEILAALITHESKPVTPSPELGRRAVVWADVLILELEVVPKHD